MVFLLVLVASLLVGGVALAADMPSAQVHTLGELTLTFSPEGVLTSLTKGDQSITLDGLYTDVGVATDKAFLLATMGFERYVNKSTWDLANIVPVLRDPNPMELVSFTASEAELIVTQQIAGIQLEQHYTALGDSLGVDVIIQNLREDTCEVHGVHFFLRGITATEDTTVEFPGNFPSGEIRIGDLRSMTTKQTAYANPVSMVRDNTLDSFNAVFLDTEEKWATAVYRNSENKLFISNTAMVEAMVAPGESIYVGKLYLHFTDLADPYAPLQGLYANLGYVAGTNLDGVATGPMYSCHPAGTMDSGWQDTKTMTKFAESLEGLAAMGIKNLWILPIFNHLDRNVYSPTDQAVIDPRYGTDEDVRYFVATAHDLGMKVLFDYVPHGPEPQDPLAVEHPEWCATKISGSLQIEWDCVSFDMANKDYQAYTKDLIKDHVARFDIDGGRIDCAMGGLSNWNPWPGNRASSSSLKGGVEIVATIREGLLESGKTPTLLPENFHPVPFYAGVTDIFYDMPLYRVMYELRQKRLTEEEYATQVLMWLESEYKSSVPGLQKLRFLGNHDTADWTWDAQRPAEVYGVDKAKALWVLMSTIDGIPYVLAGDEDSRIYHGSVRINLVDFFTELFAAREEYLAQDMTTEYLINNEGIAVFIRENEEARRLVLINLCEGDKTIDVANFGIDPSDILYGTGSIDGDNAILPGYSYLLVDL